MSIFEYVMVLVSVVLSLGLAKVLESHAGLLQLKARVKWSATYLVWLALIILFQIDLWASLWLVHTAEVWTWPSIAGALLAAMALFYAAVLAAPRVEAEETIDLWAFHLANRRWYVGAAAAYGLIGGYLNATVLGAHFTMANFTSILPILGLMIVVIVFSNRWIQRIVPVIILAVLLFYFSQYLPQFRG